MTVAKHVYGYARVSAQDQNLDRQYDALLKFPVEERNIFADKASGKDFNRPEYKRLMSRVKPGDVMVVKSIDRLGRDYQEILEQWRYATQEKQIAIVVLDMPVLNTQGIDDVTGRFLSDMVLQLLSYVAQVERDNIRQRQAEGIASAKARGVRFGRPPLEIPEGFPEASRQVSAGLITHSEAADRLGVSLSTFDRWLKAQRVSENMS